MSSPGAHAGPPRVAVVVSTHDRRDLALRATRALLAQDHDDFEVVVVDDCSKDDTATALGRLDDPRLRVLRTAANGGPAHGRNTGWAATDASWVAFTDDDCVAATDWLRQLEAAGADADVVQGATRPDPADAHHAGPWSRSLDIPAFSHRFETANLAVRRDLLVRLGGFDEDLRTGEDTDLGWRAIEAGARVAFAPQARVVHAVWPRTFGQFLRERRRWTSIVRVVRRHPGFRRHLFLHVFYRPAHGMIVVGVPVLVGASVVGGWVVLPVTAAAWVLLYVARTSGTGWPLHRRALRAVQTLVAATWEVWLFTRASLRHRTLLL